MGNVIFYEVVIIDLFMLLFYILAAPIASSDSGIEDDLTTEYPVKSPKLIGAFPIKNSPKRDYDFHECSKRSPERLLNAVKYLQKSSLKEESKPQLSPMRVFESDNCPQRSPRKHEPVEYKHRSPKRHIDVNETHVKKIKLEEPDDHGSPYHRSLSNETYHRSLSNETYHRSLSNETYHRSLSNQTHSSKTYVSILDIYLLEGRMNVVFRSISN